MRFALTFYLKDSFGGAERRLTRIYNDLCARDKDLECDIVVRGCDLATARRIFSEADCRIDHIRRLIAFRSSASCLAYFFLNRNYRWIHFFSATSFNLALERICRITKKKSLYTVCGYREAYHIALTDEQWERACEQLKRADCVDLLYPSGYDTIRGYCSGRIHITPGTFTDLEIFKPAEKKRTIVFAAARLDETKNPRLFLETLCLCASQLREKGYRAFLLGKGQDEEYLRAYIAQHDLEDIVEMKGYDRTSKYLPRAGVFFSLQKYENYPSQSLAEAVASGCYPIITDVGDSRRCAEESFASYIDDDPEQAAEALRRYLAMNDTEKDELVRAARAFAETHYQIYDSIDYYSRILHEAQA